MKRSCALIIGIISALNLAACPGVFAAPRNVYPLYELQKGDCFTLGEYNGEPILWRYIGEVENGKLAISDKVLCEKPFGDTNYWNDSCIRKWLNSEAGADAVDWASYITGEDIANVDLDIHEGGFLSESNFTAEERSAIKPVTQWTMLPTRYVYQSENDIYDYAYNPIEVCKRGYWAGKDSYKPGEYKFHNLGSMYDYFYRDEGAAHKLTDMMFLPDEEQIYKVGEAYEDTVQRNRKETLKAKMRDSYSHSKEENNHWLKTDGYCGYGLRTPFNARLYPKRGETNMGVLSDGTYSYCYNLAAQGIRPAFYLNEETAVHLSGNGSEESPYVVTGKQPEDTLREITVIYNGEKIEFSQRPVMWRDRIFVPLAEFFKFLGFEVSCDREYVSDTAIQTLSGTNGKDSVYLIVGLGYEEDGELFKYDSTFRYNGTDITPCYLSTMSSRDTKGPIRVIAETMGATVEWLDGEHMVIITK